MGSGEQLGEVDRQTAFTLGQYIAQQGWVLLSGGRNAGVMDAVNKGAKSAGGLTVGILPRRNTEMISDAVDIPIITDMGNARNNINVLSSHVLIACGEGGAGTASEIALAIKAKKHVILLNESSDAERYFARIGSAFVHLASNPEKAIAMIKELISAQAAGHPIMKLLGAFHRPGEKPLSKKPCERCLWIMSWRWMKQRDRPRILSANQNGNLAHDHQPHHLRR